MGHRVTVITTTKDVRAGPSSSDIEILRHPALLSILNNPISGAVFRELKLLRSCDVVHLHNEHAFLSMSAMTLKRFFTAPIVVTLHGTLKFDRPPIDLFANVYRTIV